MTSRRPAVVTAAATTATLTALTVSGCGIGLHFGQYRYTMTPADAHVTGATELVVRADSGHIRVTGGGTGVTIHRVIRYQSGTPHPGQRLDGGVLTLTDGCTRCSISYDITVPSSIRVRARADSGRVEVAGVAAVDAAAESGAVSARNVHGAATLRADSGSVTADDVGGTFTAAASSGAIRATGLRSARAQATADSGVIHLGFATAPSDVRAIADSGAITISVPGGPYAIDMATGSGRKEISPRIRTDPNAASRIYLRTDSGPVLVEPA